MKFKVFILIIMAGFAAQSAPGLANSMEKLFQKISGMTYMNRSKGAPNIQIGSAIHQNHIRRASIDTGNGITKMIVPIDDTAHLEIINVPPSLRNNEVFDKISVRTTEGDGKIYKYGESIMDGIDDFYSTHPEIILSSRHNLPKMELINSNEISFALNQKAPMDAAQFEELITTITKRIIQSN